MLSLLELRLILNASFAQFQRSPLRTSPSLPPMTSSPWINRLHRPPNLEPPHHFNSKPPLNIPLFLPPVTSLASTATMNNGFPNAAAAALFAQHFQQV